MRIEVRSRVGNAILGVVGVLYVCAGAALLIYDLVQTWGASSLVEHAVQLALIVSVISGAFFAVTAVRNLSPPRHEARHRREGTAVSP